MTEERRITAGALRVDQADGSLLPVIRGYALVFHSLSEDLGGFREVVHPDFVTRTLREGIDLRAYVDHNPERILGRLSAGTLRVRPDAHGLAIEIDPPETTVGRDVVVSLRRRDLSGMSFSFRTVGEDQSWWDFSTNPPTRTLRDGRIGEVSVVAQPAYADTTAAVRAMQAARAPGRSVALLQRQLRQRMATWR